MNALDTQYQNLLRDVLDNGVRKKTRSGDVLSVFGRTIRHSFKDGKFPILTTKKVFWRGVVEELLWFLKGETNIRPLVLKGINIWVGDAYKAYVKRDSVAYNRMLEESLNDKSLPQMPDYVPMTQEQFIELIKTDEKFADEYGELGPVYGKQWGEWNRYSKTIPDNYNDYEYHAHYDGPVDQIAEVIHLLRTSPDSRRMLVSAWNVAEVPDVVLPPCHYSFQFYTHVLSLEERIKWAEENHCHFDVLDEFGINSHETVEENTERIHARLTQEWQVPERGLSLMWNQRSVDTPLGLGFNITSYGALLTMIAKHVNMVPHELIGNLGDTHIYLDQIDGVKEQLTRESLPLPTLRISDRKVDDIAEYTFEDLVLENYQSHAAIKMPLSN